MKRTCWDQSHASSFWATCSQRTQSTPAWKTCLAIFSVGRSFQTSILVRTRNRFDLSHRCVCCRSLLILLFCMSITLPISRPWPRHRFYCHGGGHCHASLPHCSQEVWIPSATCWGVQFTFSLIGYNDCVYPFSNFPNNAKLGSLTKLAQALTLLCAGELDFFTFSLSLLYSEIRQKS